MTIFLRIAVIITLFAVGLNCQMFIDYANTILFCSMLRPAGFTIESYMFFKMENFE